MALHTYDYTAVEVATGRKLSAALQAEDEHGAVTALKVQGLTPVKIELRKQKSGLFGSRGVRTKERVLFTRQLSTMVNAGLPITQSLRSVSGQSSARLQEVTEKIIHDVESGTSLAKALKKYPKVFDGVYVNLVAAGEASGTLGEALERLADQQEKDAETASKIKGAMYYPAIVLLVINAVIIFMLTTVLPQVEQLYVDLGEDLPFITNILLSISNLILRFWYLAILGVIAVVFLFRAYLKTDGGKSVIDTIKPNMPLFGKLFRKVYMARFARTAQTLMAAGVPMLDMMDITASAINNVHLEKSIYRASEKVKGGMALSESITPEPLFLSLVPQMVKIGEDSGQIDTMLGRAAGYYEKEVDNQVKTISTTIEPVLMIVLGLVALVMVAAILLPIYGLVGNTSL